MDFPLKGLPYEIVQQKLRDFETKSRMTPADMDKRIDGTYHLYGMPDVKELAGEAFVRFMESEPVWVTEEGVRQMEREVISMLAKLWGSENSPGFMTAGGTESNITALYASRNLAKGKHGSVVMPSTAHPSLFKGCHLLGLEPVPVPVRDDFVADVERMRNAVRNDTIAIVASCGTWPWGTIDPIQEIGEIAEENSLYFHVDASVGGLLCPWLKGEIGYDIPEFGFKVKGVSSIGSDPHKMGYAVPPAGAMVFRDEEHKKLASWAYTEGDRIRYATYGVLGTRPGSTIAMTWALFNYLGRDGYTRLSRKCMELTMSFVGEVQKIPGLSPLTTPKVNLASVYSTTLNMDSIKRWLAERGWIFNRSDGKPMTRENLITAWLVPYNEKVMPFFLKDLREAATEVSEKQ
jgi:glutamate/tyrosine decarboxylase-like PLP-dependent enzyme